MNYTTDFKSIRAEVSAQEWQARVDLAACTRRPYGVLERPAMLRLFEAEDRHLGQRDPGRSGRQGALRRIGAAPAAIGME